MVNESDQWRCHYCGTKLDDYRTYDYGNDLQGINDEVWHSTCVAQELTRRAGAMKPQPPVWDSKGQRKWVWR